MSPDTLKAIRTALFKRTDLTFYLPVILSCTDFRTLDSLYITIVRLCVKDKRVLFVPASPNTVMTYSHVKPAILQTVMHIHKVSGEEVIIQHDELFNYNKFFNIDDVEITEGATSIKFMYVQGAYDEMKKREKAQAQGMVLCAVPRRTPIASELNIKIRGTKQLVLDALTDHGIPNPIGKIISRTGIFLKKPDYTQCTPEQIKVAETIRTYFKAHPGRQVTLSILIDIIEGRKH